MRVSKRQQKRKAEGGRLEQHRHPQWKNPLKKRSQITRQQALLLLIATVAIAVVVILAFSGLFRLSDDQASGNNASAGADSTEEEALPTVTEDEALMAFSEYSFYQEERNERYLDYQDANPALSSEQVVMCVNLDLDRAAYEFSTQVPDPSSLLVLVNKHHSLPYDYQPTDLIDYGPIQIRSEMKGPLDALLAESQADGVHLMLCSGYRSAAYQEGLYNEYVYSDGMELTDTQSARPGFSEHQTGWTIDFDPPDSRFSGSAEARWLADNAYRYGFIVRYTEENATMTLYTSEPWHIRYVGTDVSRFMHDNTIGSFEEYWAKYVQETLL